MNRVKNPYSPGAGTPPPALVGRVKQLEDMDVALDRRLLGRPAKGLMLTGLRGVGKTVLLNEFGNMASAKGYVCEHIEADEHIDFPAILAAMMRKILLRLSASHRFNDKIQRTLGILKAFSLKLPGGPELSIDVSPVAGPADSGDLSSDLAGLLSEIGQVARDLHAGVFVTVDEIQYLAPDQLSAFMVGLHRVAQLSLPLIVTGAGLPSLVGSLGEAKSYAERMFEFLEVGSLTPNDVADALVVPANQEGVSWQPGAVELVGELTQGYPYFIQEFGKQVWDVAPGPTEITRLDVKESVELAMTALDIGFFRMRIDRTTDAERGYLRAMASLGPGPQATAHVAAILRKNLRQVGPVRDNLIKRGICYAPRWGQIAFTVPMFDEFMRRWMPREPHE